MLRPPAHPFEAILLYDRNQLKTHYILCFRLSIGDDTIIKQTLLYDNIAEKGCAGGLNYIPGKTSCFIYFVQRIQLFEEISLNSDKHYSLELSKLRCYH